MNCYRNTLFQSATMLEILYKGRKVILQTHCKKDTKNADPSIITPCLPPDWTPQCSILINTVPLPNHFNLANYGTFLMKRFIISQFKKGSSEVHVIFDSPGRLENTPKYYEQKHRDSKAAVAASNHVCADLTSSTLIPLEKLERKLSQLQKMQKKSCGIPW